MINSRRTPRLWIRIACLVLAVLLVCPLPFWIYHSKVVAQASPFVTICTMLAGGAVGLGSVYGLGFSIVVIFRKRWFCYYICPAGLLLDWVSGTGLSKGTWWNRCPPIGRYIVLLTIAGAVTGYPLLLWIDPLVFFNSAFSVYTSTGYLPGVLSIAGIAIMLFIAFTSGNLWCARICPLGATQDILSDIRSLPEKLKKRKTTAERPEPAFSLPVTRRFILALATGAGLGFYFKGMNSAHSGIEVLRPPGAIERLEFKGQCIRCGNCIRACPSNIIYPDTGQAGISGFMAPALGFKKGYCDETCNACTMVCPSGALKKLTLEEKNKYSIGKAILNPSLCYMVRGVNDCDICVRSCPFGAVQTYWNDESYIAFPFVDTMKCNGCGACERFCPTGNVRAITVGNITEY